MHVELRREVPLHRCDALTGRDQGTVATHFELQVALPTRTRMDSACAASPSACAISVTNGAIRSMPSAEIFTACTRRMKSSTPRTLENRAVANVGSTWLGPAM